MTRRQKPFGAGGPLVYVLALVVVALTLGPVVAPESDAAVIETATLPRASRALATALFESRAALARSEERLSLAFAASGALAWWDWDIPADRFFASDSFARLSGVDPGEMRAGVPAAAELPVEAEELIGRRSLPWSRWTGWRVWTSARATCPRPA